MKKVKKSSKLEEEIDTKKGKKTSKIICDMHLDISVKSDVASPHDRGSYVTRYYNDNDVIVCDNVTAIEL